MMGLRERLRARVSQAGKRVLESIIGEGNVRGTGQAHGARTSAWPPARMGADGTDDPPPHPADLAEAGAFVEASADWSMPMHIEEAVAEAADVARRAPDPEPQTAPAPAPAPKAMTTPAGSVAQQEWLPMPRAPAPPAPEPEVQTPAPPADEPSGSAPEPAANGEAIQLSPAERDAVKDEIVATLKTVYDPEIPVDIYELGLIYGVDVSESGDAEIRMTLTSPNCPAAQSMPAEVETKTKQIAGIRDAMVDIVWDPPWGPDKMSEAARIELNIDF